MRMSEIAMPILGVIVIGLILVMLLVIIRAVWLQLVHVEETVRRLEGKPTSNADDFGGFPG